jgi:hypothetical protein
MTWKFVDDVLTKAGLQQSPLGLLEPDCSEYDVMLYQHGGAITADANGVHNADHATATAKFTTFFAHASAQQPQILATPEYACPWPALEQMVQNNHWPAAGKVWVVGCESIRPNELEEFCNRYNMVTWLAPAYAAELDQVFLDIACICLNATAADGAEIRVAVLQAKNTAMADGNHLIEPNSLIRGTDRYILRNDENSIHLALMICSDALEAGIFESLPHQEHFPYILLHVQLNSDPRNLGFRRYRDFWGTEDRKDVEIICLNWARNSELLGDSIPFGASAWYFKTQSPVAADDEVNDAHKMGVYYAESRSRYFHCQLLNYAEHVFHLRSVKVCQVRSARATHRTRTGPRAIAALSWDGDLSDWQLAQPDDGFNSSCDEIGADLKLLIDQEMSPANRERLVCLSNSAILVTSKAPWPHVRSLRSFEMTQDEVCHRVTFCHDPDAASCEQRRVWLHRFATLKNEILAGGVQFPQHLRPLQAGGEIRYPALPDKLSFNVVDTDGAFPSTFVFIGDASEQHARQVMDQISDIVSDAKRSLVVWFRQNGQLTYVCPDGVDTIDADLSESSRSILRGTLP